MPDQTVAQITFRGQELPANLFWCGGQQFLVASVPGSLAAALHPTEEKEVVVLDSTVGDRIDNETAAIIKSRLYGLI